MRANHSTRSMHVGRRQDAKAKASIWIVFHVTLKQTVFALMLSMGDRGPSLAVSPAARGRGDYRGVVGGGHCA